ncbi:HAMP domain-containing protein [Spirulina subsalsa FACHB-351]|uniref:histidine kinase n=2 Tax=Spirulina subsalsa TaxID=54311 RepID=A0ABT3LA20_9CYAN|nr:HAMP domain-containing protein [Spirulina subsalsa FACHB-351]
MPPKTRSLRTQIYWGYGASLGIAVVGTIIGLLLGDYYHSQAREELRTAHWEGKTLNSLLLKSRDFQPEREFIPVLRHPNRLAEAIQNFDHRSQSLMGLIETLQQHPELQQEQRLQSFLLVYQNVAQTYIHHQQNILKEIDLNLTDRSEVLAIEDTLTHFADSSLALRFFRYSEEIRVFIQNSQEHIEQAELALTEANTLRTKVILFSLFCSILIAALLARYTSRALVRPIQAVSDVAYQVAKTGDAELRAPVMTEDEVGVLARSLNQLIQWIQDYTQDLKEAQAQLIQTEKMSSLGQMVAGIAHEINNPVNFIYGNLSHIEEYSDTLLGLIELYQKEYPKVNNELAEQIEDSDLEFMREDLPAILHSMRMGSERIRQIVLSLRNFSRLDDSSQKAVDLHEGIDSTLILLNNRIKKEIEIVKDYGELPPVPCYPAQLNQVFMNLLSNAIDALSDNKSNPQKQIKIHTEASEDSAKITIADNGVGIPETIRSKLFDPFFTTKPIGKGTGLGLAISYKIMEKHDGKIQVDSTPGEGTAFTLILPLHPNRSGKPVSGKA